MFVCGLEARASKHRRDKTRVLLFKVLDLNVGVVKFGRIFLGSKYDLWSVKRKTLGLVCVCETLKRKQWGNGEMCNRCLKQTGINYLGVI